MKFYNKKETLYLETDMTSVGLRAGLQQLRKRMNCPCDEAEDNTVLHPTAYASTAYQSQEAETLTLRENYLAYYMD